MDEHDGLTERFEAHRAHLHAVAYRMLGSLSEADNAVRETWLRVDRSGTSDVENLGAWSTTVVARVCLNMLRSRESRRAKPFVARLPDPIVGSTEPNGPEHHAPPPRSVGLALLVALESLAPAERLAFVLHDMFAVSFEEIAPIVDRSPAATAQLTSRVRSRVWGSAPIPDPDLGHQRAVVDAFLAATDAGDFAALVAVLDPDVVLRADRGPGTCAEVRGPRAVAVQALTFRRFAHFTRPALVNGAAGLVTAAGGRTMAIVGFTINSGRIVTLDILNDPARLSRLEIPGPDD